MKKTKLKAIFSIVAVMLVITAFSIPAFAAESYYASDESGNTSIPSSIDSITISKADVDIPYTGDKTNELTPDGNMSLIDDFLQMGGYITSGKEDEEIKSKQFLTVTSKSGNTFYIVIDRDGDKENVYLLNLVDEADLMALINDGEVDDEWIDTVYNYNYTGSHSVQLSSTGTYRVTVEYVIYGSGGAVDTITKEIEKNY